jgi:hypothetical protein
MSVALSGACGCGAVQFEVTPQYPETRPVT